MTGNEKLDTPVTAFNKYPSASLVTLLILVVSGQLFGQGLSIYPRVLYPGVNVITITSPDGIAQVQRRLNGVWGNFLTGEETTTSRIIAGPIFSRCGATAKFMILIKSISTDVNLQLRVVDCQDNSEVAVLAMGNTWRVSREDFGTMSLGTTLCHDFEVSARIPNGETGRGFLVDSIYSPSRQFTIQYIQQRPPLHISPGSTYRYRVCFTPRTTGMVAMPILVYIHRDQPAGGFSNFIVADTAYIRVSPSIAKPVRPVVRIRPRPIPIPRPPDTVPVPIADVDSVQLRSLARRSEYRDTGRLVNHAFPVAVSPPALSISDPTPFRLILGPTARPINAKEMFISNYDGAGWLLGVGVSERLSIIGGFVYVPPAIAYTLAINAGGRYVVYSGDFLQIAGGVHANYSRTDASSITLVSPFAVASLGDDDRKLSLTVGTSWRRHVPVGEEPFTRVSTVIGGGGDLRVAYHWKLVGEAYYIQGSDLQPLAATVRYFTENFAVDAGMGVNVSGNGAGQIAPIISIMASW